MHFRTHLSPPPPPTPPPTFHFLLRTPQLPTHRTNYSVDEMGNPAADKGNTTIGGYKTETGNQEGEDLDGKDDVISVPLSHIEDMVNTLKNATSMMEFLAKPKPGNRASDY